MTYIKSLFILFLLSLAACGQGAYYVGKGEKGDKGDTGAQGDQGQQGSAGAQGPAGQNGANGTNGVGGYNGLPGHNALISLVSFVSNTNCSAGGVTILSGTDMNDDGSLQGIETTRSADVCNGAAAPTTPFTPVALINPCGDAPGVYDEVFLKLSNGTLLASFSDNASGTNTRFAALSPGTFVTTDGDNCTFTVDSFGNITNESKHY